MISAGVFTVPTKGQSGTGGFYFIYFAFYFCAPENFPDEIAFQNNDRFIGLNKEF